MHLYDLLHADATFQRLKKLAFRKSSFLWHTVFIIARCPGLLLTSDALAPPKGAPRPNQDTYSPRPSPRWA